jgi:predicted metalloendopeptidase
VNVGADQRNSEHYAVQISQSGSACRIAITTAQRRQVPGHAQGLHTYIARLFALVRINPDPEGAAARIVSLETELAKAQWDRARNRDRNATYNKMAVGALQDSTPHFDWQAYLGALPAGHQGQD